MPLLRNYLYLVFREGFSFSKIYSLTPTILEASLSLYPEISLSNTLEANRRDTTSLANIVLTLP